MNVKMAKKLNETSEGLTHKRESYNSFALYLSPSPNKSAHKNGCSPLSHTSPVLTVCSSSTRSGSDNGNAFWYW